MASSPSSPRLSALPARDIRRLCTVIARPRNKLQQQFDAHTVLTEISQLLSDFGVRCTTTCIGPNYIIDPANFSLQGTILSWSPLQTSHMILDLVPWSREHEDSKLPWIIDTVQDDSAIVIDPLTILPAVSPKKTKTGSSKLKDNFCSMISNNYDLAAPDFSYLMINEIKDYYIRKHSAITMCRQIAISMASSLQDFVPKLQLKMDQVQKKIELIEARNQGDVNVNSHRVITELKAAIAQKAVEMTKITDLLEWMLCLQDVPMHLQNYRLIPPLSQVPVPSSYVKRLKTIYMAASRHVYGIDAIVTAEQISEAGFEPYVMIKGYRHRYSGIAMKTAAAAETVAIYQSLRYITNVLGYKIIDLNYPTLATLMSAVHKDSLDIIQLQSCVNAAIGYSQSICDAFNQLYHETTGMIYNVNSLNKLDACIEALANTVQHHHAAATESFHRFMDYKEHFLTTYLETQSPTNTPDPWIEVNQTPVTPPPEPTQLP